MGKSVHLSSNVLPGTWSTKQDSWRPPSKYEHTSHTKWSHLTPSPLINLKFS